MAAVFAGTLLTYLVITAVPALAATTCTLTVISVDDERIALDIDTDDDVVLAVGDAVDATIGGVAGEYRISVNGANFTTLPGTCAGALTAGFDWIDVTGSDAGNESLTILHPDGTGAGQGIDEENTTVHLGNGTDALTFEWGAFTVPAGTVADPATDDHITFMTADDGATQVVDQDDSDDVDLRIDAFRSSGPGGQSVNKTSSAIRVTHIPSGLVVSCQDEKSQHKNKAKALKILRSRLYDLERQKANQARSTQRKTLIGSGDRSERIRTYNFPESRISDHRIKLNLYNLPAVLEGDLDELIESLASYDREQRLQGLADGIA